MFDINEFWNSEIKLSDVMGGPKSQDILIEPLRVNQIGIQTGIGNAIFGPVNIALIIEFGCFSRAPNSYYSNNIDKVADFKIKNPNINNNLCIMQTLWFDLEQEKSHSIGLMLSNNDYNKLTSFANKYANDLIEFLKSASLFA